jgi:hypothetical protein
VGVPCEGLCFGKRAFEFESGEYDDYSDVAFTKAISDLSWPARLLARKPLFVGSFNDLDVAEEKLISRLLAREDVSVEYRSVSCSAQTMHKLVNCQAARLPRQGRDDLQLQDHFAFKALDPLHHTKKGDSGSLVIASLDGRQLPIAIHRARASGPDETKYQYAVPITSVISFVQHHYRVPDDALWIIF